MTLSASRLTTILLGIVIATATVAHGVPQFRHDWSWPASRGAVIAQFWDYVSGWHVSGLGSVNAYPTDYLIVIPMTLASLLLGPATSLWLFTAALGFTIASAGARLSQVAGASAAAVPFVQCFVALNPWVYNKLVAGHLFMLLAFGALLHLAVNALQRRRVGVTDYVMLALTLQQLQFFLAALLLCCIRSIREREWLLGALGLLIGMPLFVGLYLDHYSLSQIPFYLEWQRVQSVGLLHGIELSGYFAGYASNNRLFTATAWLLPLVVIVGGVFGRSDRRLITAIIVASIGIFLSAGVWGPFAPAYEWAVLHFRQTALLRELYDVIAVVAVAYAFVLAVASKYVKAFVLPIAVLSVSYAAAWIALPPASFWPSARDVQHASVPFSELPRFALEPLTQPVSYDDKGSGEDPDAYAHGLGRRPLNGYLPAYPLTALLATTDSRRCTRLLASLGVDVLIARANVFLDTASLKKQRGMAQAAHPCHTNGMTTIVGAASMAQRGTEPQSSALALPYGANVTTISDRKPGVFTPLSSDRVCATLACGWVDAPAVVLPEGWNQGTGGIVTSSSTPVALNEGWYLVRVHGHFIASGSDVRDRGLQFRWIRVSTGNATCTGLCLIVGRAQSPLAIDGRPEKLENLPWRPITPWLSVTTVPAEGKPWFLRYNESFDPGWMLVDLPAQHVRVDGAVNGWYMGPLPASRIIYIMHWVSALQAALEVLAALGAVLVFVFATSWHLRFRAHHFNVSLGKKQ